MEYDFKTKKINKNIELTRIECEIFEELIKFNGQPISAKMLVDIIYKKYCITYINIQDPSENCIKVWICRLNKKINKIIKCKRGLGYYIEEEIKIM